jgi:hypothetical protein
LTVDGNSPHDELDGQKGGDGDETAPDERFLLVVGGVALTGLNSLMSASDESQSVSEVWAREEEYWRSVEAGDVESYVALWHERFIGWPCGEDHPMRKSSIGGWVQEIRDKKITLTSTLTREGAEDFGAIVVVHYRSTMVSAYPDGRVRGRGREQKITHTWMKVGSTWQIVGGMCADLAQREK